MPPEFVSAVHTAPGKPSKCTLHNDHHQSGWPQQTQSDKPGKKEDHLGVGGGGGFDDH